jgi:nucleoside-diphosphate-sugar epimerase
MATSTEKFLVTGAAGCIGAWAVRLLLDEGVPVLATDLSPDLRRFTLISPGRTDDKLEFDQLDVTSGPAVAAMVADRGVYKAANEGTAKVYARQHGIGSICLRPFIVYGLGRDQGMTSDPTKAMLAAAAGVPFTIKFGGNVLLTYAPDCARAFIASARAAAGSGDAVSLNVPGRRITIPALVDLIETVLPGSARLISWDDRPLPVPSLLSAPALRDAVGDVPNAVLADGVRETIAGFQAALAAGLVSPPVS